MTKYNDDDLTREDDDMTREQKAGQQNRKDTAKTQDKEFYQEIDNRRDKSQGENSEDKMRPMRREGQMDQDDMDEESR
jgi:hypothetical protein